MKELQRESFEEKKMFRQKPPVSCMVVPVNNSVRTDAIKIAQILRREGVACDTDLMERKIGKQLEYASSAGVAFSIIVGEKELKSKSAVLRDMKSGKERTVKLDRLSSVISDYSG